MLERFCGVWLSRFTSSDAADYPGATRLVKKTPAYQNGLQTEKAEARAMERRRVAGFASSVFTLISTTGVGSEILS